MYSRTYDFIKSKLSLIKNFDPVAKKIAEEKLVVLIQELGTEFVKFVNQNSVMNEDIIQKSNVVAVNPVSFNYDFLLI